MQRAFNSLLNREKLAIEIEDICGISQRKEKGGREHFQSPKAELRYRRVICCNSLHRYIQRDFI